MELRVAWPQVAAFRLARQHLDGGRAASVAALCRDACGMQAQVLSAAYLALWTRNHALTRAAIDASLQRERTLVRTSLMRGTLHLLAAEDYPLYMRALRSNRLRQMRAVMGRYGVKAAEGDVARDAAVEALAAGPLLRRELQQRVLAGRSFSRKSLKWFTMSWWGVVRQAIVEGAVCYGPEREGETALIRTEEWLGRQKEWIEREAQQELLRRYLRAYGPATPRDFAYWSGLSMGEVRPVWESLREEMAELAVEGAAGKGCAMLAGDVKHVRKARLREPAVRLLPNFDVYLLGHADKSWLMDLRHYKRVFRSAGWISPVVLVDGRVAGVWSSETRGKRLRVRVEPFEKLSAKARTQINEEAEALGGFLGLEAEARIAR